MNSVKLVVVLLCAVCLTQAKRAKKTTTAHHEHSQEPMLTTAPDENSDNDSDEDDTGEAVLTPKIINGVDADPGELPYQAQLLYHGYETYHICGGSLIHPSYVLTAKHCMFDYVMGRYTVRLGVHNRLIDDPFITEHTPIEIIKHPTSDLAILHITPRANFTNPRIRVVSLAHRTPPVGKAATASGWGMTMGFNFSSSSDILQKVNIPIADPNICNADLPEECQVEPDRICAGIATGDYTNVCHGDSGGPLVARDSAGRIRQVGVVYCGFYGCPSEHHYAVYTDVTVAAKWIIENIYNNNIHRPQ